MGFCISGLYIMLVTIMKRRQFLYSSSGALLTPLMASAAQGDTGAVDFGRLVTSTYGQFPDYRSDIEPKLMELAETIHVESEPVGWDDINELRAVISDSSTATRRLEFVIQILHNNHMARYVDDAWIAAVRNNSAMVTRYLPLIGSFNNLHESAEQLDEAGSRTQDVGPEPYDQFAYAILAFCLEVGLFYIGTPYRMAWRGTRFVSNRTVLRAGRYVDNRLIALIMSEIHWQIRSHIYEDINRDNIGSTIQYIQFLGDEFGELENFADTNDIQDAQSGKPYLETVDLDVGVTDIGRFDAVRAYLDGRSDDLEEELTRSEVDLQNDGSNDGGPGLPIDISGL
jgi:hypothetical protein